MEYLIQHVSLREPFDSHCQVVRASDNVQVYVGHRGACERFIQRVRALDECRHSYTNQIGVCVDCGFNTR